MNIYGIIVGVTACEVITLQMERMDVSHSIFYILMYKLAIVVEIYKKPPPINCFQMSLVSKEKDLL